MATFNHVQTNFTAGRLSPKIQPGRIDLQKYSNGAKTLKNCVVMPQGGVIACPGTRYVGRTASSSSGSRLVPFRFSASQAYIFEFSRLNIRIYKDEGVLLGAGGNPYDFASPYEVGDIDDITFAQYGDSLLMFHPDYKIRKFSRGADHVTWSLTEYPLVDGPYDSINKDLDNYLTSDGKSGSRATLTIGDADSAVTYTSVEEGSYENGIRVWHKDPGANDSPLTVSVTDRDITVNLATNSGGSITSTAAQVKNAVNNDVDAAALVTASNPGDGTGYAATTTGLESLSGGKDAEVTLVSNKTLFAATDVDRHVRIGNQTDNGDIEWGWGIIKTFESDTKVVLTVKRELFKSAADSNNYQTNVWRLGSFSETTGYPSLGTFHEQRLWLANTYTAPQDFYASKSGDFPNFQPSDFVDSSVTDENGIKYTIASGSIDEILWLSSGRHMLAGTASGVFKIKASALGEAITPKNISVSNEIPTGATGVEPVRVDQSVLYAQLSKRKIVEVFNDPNQSLSGISASDLTIFSDDILGSGVKQIVYQQNPYNILWCLKSDGSVVAVTYNALQEIVAWHEHDFGGQVKSMAVIPSPDGSHDQLWMIVLRSPDGILRYQVEFMEDFFDPETDIEDSFFVKGGLTYDGAATKTISGLDHLEGYEVSIVADGAAHSKKTVSSGEVTLDYEASKVHVGLFNPPQLDTVSFDRILSQGTSQVIKGRTVEAHLLFYRSLGAQVGEAGTGLYEDVLFRDFSDNMDEPSPLFSGWKSIILNSGFSEEKSVSIVQPNPLPMSLLAIVAETKLGG